MIEDLPVAIGRDAAVRAWLHGGARAVMLQGGGPGQRASIALFWDGDSAPRVFMKTARDPGGQAALLREHRTLTSLYAQESLRPGIPEPLALIEEPGLTVHVTRAIPGVPLTVLGSRRRGAHGAPLDAALRWLERLQVVTAGERLHVDLAELESHLADDLPGAVHDRFRRRVLDAGDSLTRCELRAVRCHGDFWAGNLVYSRGRISVIDWEHSRESGPPSDDLFLLLSTVSLTPRGLLTARDRVRAFESAWLGSGRTTRRCSSAALRFLASRGLGPQHMDVLMVLFLTRMVRSPVGADAEQWRAILRSYAAVPALFLRRSGGVDS